MIRAPEDVMLELASPSMIAVRRVVCGEPVNDPLAHVEPASFDMPEEFPTKE